MIASPTTDRVLAIDPGTTSSAWVVYDGARVLAHGIDRNPDLLDQLREMDPHFVSAVVIEQVESFGLAVGAEVFETVFWSGRFFERSRGKGARVTRRAVKLHLCGQARAKDANIRQALIDRFGGLEAKGTKKAPGPLYGLRSHEWAALAVAVTWVDQQAEAGDLLSAYLESR